MVRADVSCRHLCIAGAEWVMIVPMKDGVTVSHQVHTGLGDALLRVGILAGTRREVSVLPVALHGAYPTVDHLDQPELGQRPGVAADCHVRDIERSCQVRGGKEPPTAELVQNGALTGRQRRLFPCDAHGLPFPRVHLDD